MNTRFTKRGVVLFSVGLACVTAGLVTAWYLGKGAMRDLTPRRTDVAPPRTSSDNVGRGPVMVGAAGPPSNPPLPSPSPPMTNPEFLTADVATQIATNAIGDLHYDKKTKVSVELDGNVYRVTFPIDQSSPPGTRFRGADYAAEVRIDARSGKVLELKRGS
jgi:hypothetical protein